MSTADRDVETIEEPRRRYPSEDVRMPEDVSHPHTTEDESSQSWRERILGGTSKVLLAAALFAGVAIVGYGVYLFGSVIFDFLMNPWVQAGILGGVVLSIGVITGARRERAAVSHTDTLVLLLPNGLREFQGEYVETGDGPAFIPYRGRAGLLRSQDPYTLEQLSAELPRLDSKNHLSNDDEVVIDLPSAFAQVAVTDRGVSACVNTDGLKAAHFSSTAALRCETPSMAHEGRLQDANDMIQELQDDVATYRRRLNATMNRLSYLLEDNDQRREDIREAMKDLYIDLREADRRTDPRRSGESTSSAGTGWTAEDVFGGEES